MTAFTGKAAEADELAVLFTRYPEPGKTKTRLIEALGPQGAADLQRQMTEKVLQTLTALTGRRRISLEVRFEGGSQADMQQWLAADLAYRPQGDGDLGQRLQRSFAQAFSAGFQRVVVVGADCPALSTELLSRGLDLLGTNELVLGPATDGGYYLVGLVRPIPELFTDIPWGTDKVLARTLRCAGLLNLSVALLDPLADVDRPEDLDNFHHHTCAE